MYDKRLAPLSMPDRPGVCSGQALNLKLPLFTTTSRSLLCLLRPPGTDDCPLKLYRPYRDTCGVEHLAVVTENARRRVQRSSVLHLVTPTCGRTSQVRKCLAFPSAHALLFRPLQIPRRLPMSRRLALFRATRTLWWRNTVLEPLRYMRNPLPPKASRCSRQENTGGVPSLVRNETCLEVTNQLYLGPTSGCDAIKNNSSSDRRIPTRIPRPRDALRIGNTGTLEIILHPAIPSRHQDVSWNRLLMFLSLLFRHYSCVLVSALKDLSNLDQHVSSP